MSLRQEILPCSLLALHMYAVFVLVYRKVFKDAFFTWVDSIVYCSYMILVTDNTNSQK